MRKDLLRRLRPAYSVPTFVIEFLLGKYCASTDATVIEQGLEFVRRNLSERFVKPDEREMVKAEDVPVAVELRAATFRPTTQPYHPPLTSPRRGP